MSQIIILNGMSGLVVRNAINSMNSELYSAIVTPLKLPGINANTQQTFQANTYLSSIFILGVSGTPTIRIGTTPNGQELCPDIQPVGSNEISIQQYFSAGATIYITLSGGVCSLRIDSINNFY